MNMHAAVVRSFDHPPCYEDYPVPRPAEPDEVLLDVLAVGLHPRVRSDAAGRHYTSTGSLPMIPGVDGVGRLPDGERVYFVVPDGRWGSMAERAIADRRRTVPLAADVAHTWLQLATSEVPGAWWRRLVGSMGGRTFLSAFLARLDRAEAAACMSVVREYRLARRELTPRERRAVANFAVGER